MSQHPPLNGIPPTNERFDHHAATTVTDNLLALSPPELNAGEKNHVSLTHADLSNTQGTGSRTIASETTPLRTAYASISDRTSSPAISPEELYIPLAETWHYNRPINNRHGDTIFCLLQEEQVGRLIPSSSSEPILRMIIGDANRQVVAVIVRDAKHSKDGYTIYSPRSAVDTLFETTDNQNNEQDHLTPLRRRSPPTLEETVYRFEYHPHGSFQQSLGLKVM